MEIVVMGGALVLTVLVIGCLNAMGAGLEVTPLLFGSIFAPLALFIKFGEAQQAKQKNS